ESAAATPKRREVRGAVPTRLLRQGAPAEAARLCCRRPQSWQQAWQRAWRQAWSQPWDRASSIWRPAWLAPWPLLWALRRCSCSGRASARRPTRQRTDRPTKHRWYRALRQPDARARIRRQWQAAGPILGGFSRPTAASLGRCESSISVTIAIALIGLA